MLFEAIVAAVKSEGGFDVSDITAGGWVNEVYAEAVARSGYMQAVLSLGTTVVAQATYALDETIADVERIYIDSGDGPAHYGRIGTTDMWELKGGRRQLVGSGGVFAPAFSTAGAKQIELNPAPVTAGLSIMALVALVPADLVNGQSPAIPREWHRRILDGASAIGLERIDGVPGAAQLVEDRISALEDLLRRRRNSRIGSEPGRMQLEGFDF